MPLITLKKEKLDQTASEYLNTIENPIQQYAMRVQLTTKCTPEIAAAAAIAHYRINDPDGNIFKVISKMIEMELKNMEQQKTAQA